MSGCAPPTLRSVSGILACRPESWLARQEVGPLPSFGARIVASCAATAANRSGMCSAHSIAWCRDHGGVGSGRVGAACCPGGRGRARGDLAQVPGAGIRPDARQLLRWLVSELYCLLSGPERERARDIWQLRVFGLPGKLDFAGISLRWLREAVKWLAAEDLPLRRGRAPADSPRDSIRAAAALSQSCACPAATAGTNPPRSAARTSPRSPAGWRTCSGPGK
jgi:hypothetical protein